MRSLSRYRYSTRPRGAYDGPTRVGLASEPRLPSPRSSHVSRPGNCGRCGSRYVFWRFVALASASASTSTLVSHFLPGIGVGGREWRGDGQQAAGGGGIGVVVGVADFELTR